MGEEGTGGKTARGKGHGEEGTREECRGAKGTAAGHAASGYGARGTWGLPPKL